MFDPDAFEERAAVLQYDEGLSRFRSEAEAARRQGVSRWEAIGHVAGRLVAAASDRRAAMARHPSANDMPAMQRDAQEKARPVPERDGSR